MKKIIFLILFAQSIIVLAQERPVEYIMVETPPIYNGCESYKTTSSKSVCSNNKLMDHIGNNFDSSVSSNTTLDSGVYEVMTIFIVDKNGKITNVETNGSDYAPFVNEAKRLIKLLPPFTTPGFQRGKVVSVRYRVPISFTVEKN